MIAPLLLLVGFLLSAWAVVRAYADLGRSGRHVAPRVDCTDALRELNRKIALAAVQRIAR